MQGMHSRMSNALGSVASAIMTSWNPSGISPMPAMPDPLLEPTRVGKPQRAAQLERALDVMTLARIRGKSIAGLLLVVAASGACGAEFEFRFWPAAGADKDPRFVRFDDGPCGQVATARVQSMPRYAKTALFVPERVLEINSRGEVVRRWVIPVDATPYALDGSSLIFEFKESLYQVTTARAISRLQVQANQRRAEPESMQCAAPKEFLPSNYVACWQFKDRRSGSKRLLAFEGVCT